MLSLPSSSLHRALRALLLTAALAGAVACQKEETRPESYTLNTGPAPTPGPGIAPGDAVVYEAFVRDASPAGTFEGLIPRLDSIKALGCNVLWLMPIHPIGEKGRAGSLGSPYAVRDYTAVAPAMGSLASFDNLVNEAHKRNLVVILDWVANHTAKDHPWVGQHPDWYTRDSRDSLVSPLPEWQDVWDLDFNNAELRREMIRAMRFWVQRHGVDGFRCDAADFVPDTFWQEASDSLNAVRSNLFWLAEGSTAGHYAAGFQLNYGWDFYTALKQVIKQGGAAGSLNAVHTRELAGVPAGKGRVRFTTNHDFTFTEGTPPEVYGSAAAAEAAYVAMLAYGATPLIYNGQEAGDLTKLSLFEKATINWSASPATTTFYRRVLRAYNALPALRTGAVAALTLPTDVVAVLRTAANGQQAAVLVNVRATASPVALPTAWQNVGWTNALTGEAVGNAPATVTLPPYGYAIWRSQ